ncbi:MAG: NnrS family protein [Methyloprofundus sp.]|nr:NnrS family protein [Methyloprofundus sp.]
MKQQPVFALGFRVFFSVAGLSAVLLIALWLFAYSGSTNIANYYPNTFWHAHEMLFGYTVAVIAGFLLTAVKNWTGEATITDKPLAALALLWFAGRIAPFTANYITHELIALIDLLFLPSLAYALSLPLLKAKYTRGLVFMALIIMMTVSNALIHAEMLAYSEQTAWLGLQLMIALVLLMILIIAGRVFPFFTSRGAGVELSPKPSLDAWSIGSAVIVFILQVLGVTGALLAITAVIAAIINSLRLKNWLVKQVLSIPLLWVLFSAYAWIIVAFLLTALSTLAIIPATLALHAFTMGGIGVVTLAMMARVSLGHSGRDLQASKATVFAFCLINLAVLVRVIFPLLMPANYVAFVWIAGLFWIAAFLLFNFVYLPILTTARADGKSG